MENTTNNTAYERYWLGLEFRGSAVCQVRLWNLMSEAARVNVAALSDKRFLVLVDRCLKAGATSDLDRWFPQKLSRVHGFVRRFLCKLITRSRLKPMFFS